MGGSVAVAAIHFISPEPLVGEPRIYHCRPSTFKKSQVGLKFHMETH